MKLKNYFITLLLIFSDILTLIFVFYFSYWIRVKFFSVFIKGGFFPVSHYYKYWYILLIYVLFFFYEKIYFKRHTFYEEFIHIVRSIFISTIFLILSMYFIKATGQLGRTIIILMFINGIIFIPLIKYLVKYLLYKLKLYQREVAIIGKGNSIKSVYRSLSSTWYIGYKIIGFIGNGKYIKKQIKKFENGKFFGPIAELKFLIKQYNLDGVIIIEEGFSKESLKKIISECESVVPEIRLIADILTLKTNIAYSEYVNEILLLNVPNNLLIPLNRVYKRLMDIVFSLVGIFILLPFLIFIGVLIKLSSPGPIFFVQKRIGYYGNEFNFIKFRTMFVDGEERLNKFLLKYKWAQIEWAKYKKLKKHDPRVTGIGKFIRRFSIDEFPQFINVLIGNMSIVGPRPYLIRNRGYINKKYFNIIFKVKPGLTGLWQIRGRNTLTFNKRLKHDEFYVRNWSCFMDFMILAETFKVVINGKGAY